MNCLDSLSKLVDRMATMFVDESFHVRTFSSPPSRNVPARWLHSTPLRIGNGVHKLNIKIMTNRLNSKCIEVLSVIEANEPIELHTTSRRFLRSMSPSAPQCSFILGMCRVNNELTPLHGHHWIICSLNVKWLLNQFKFIATWFISWIPCHRWIKRPNEHYNILCLGQPLRARTHVLCVFAIKQHSLSLILLFD